MFRIVCDPSSGSVERAWRKLLVIFFVCVVGVWQRNFEPAVCVCLVECVWNVMAHAQKPDLVFRWNGRVHLNRRGSQFSRLLAAEVCGSAVVMLVTLSSVVVWSGVKGAGYPLHSPVFPSLPPQCVTVCHHVSIGLYDDLGTRTRHTHRRLKITLPNTDYTHEKYHE